MTDVDEDRLLLAFIGRSLPPSLHVSYDTHGFLVFQLFKGLFMFNSSNKRINRKTGNHWM